LLQSSDGVALQGSGALYKAVFGIILAYIVLMAAFGQVGTILAAPVAVLIISMVTVWLQSRGHVRRAMGLFVWGIWVAVTLQGVLRNGVANAGLFAYPAMMLLGGWVLGARQGMALGLASIGASFLIAMAEHYGLITGRRIDAHVFWYWFPMALVMATTMVAMHFILKAHWENVNAMRALNQELEQAVATLTAREQALQRSERRFHVISESNPLPIAVSRISDGRNLAVNPAWQRAFGWTQEEALARTSLELGFWEVPQQRAEWVDDLLRDGRTLDRSIHAVARDRRTVQLIVSAESIEYDGHASVLAIMMDQTVRLRTEMEIKALNEQLESRVAERTAELRIALTNLNEAQEELVRAEKLASLGQLVAGVAHELNTPIGNALVTTTALVDAARAFDAVLRSGNIKRSTVEHYVQQSLEGTALAERSLHRASDLVRSFKQVAVDQTSERRRDFDLAEAVNEVIDTLRPNLKGSPWKIRVDIGPGMRMESFPGPLGQVVINLVMNAVLHAFEKRRQGQVTLSARSVDDYAIDLVCTDDGTGIASENLNRIFDPFFTTKLGHGGSGLGLAIVHRLVTQVLGGQISVESSAQEGTAFTVRLPRVSPKLQI
jgi:PAS domain S-box-containing protein